MHWLALPLTLLVWSGLAEAREGRFRPTPPSPVTIEAVDVHIDGLGYTHESSIRRALDLSVGRVLDGETLWRDLQRIRNFGIYASVTAETYEAPNGVTVTIKITDKWTANPVFRPRGGGDQFLFELGVRDSNFLGRNINTAIYAGPYVSEASNGLLLGLEMHLRQLPGRNALLTLTRRDFWLDPIYAGDKAVTKTEVGSISSNYEFWFQQLDWLQPALTFGIERRDYSHINGVALPLTDLQTTFDVRPGAVLRIGVVDYHNYRYRGMDFEGRIFNNFRTRGPGGYIGGSLQGRLFFLPHARLNLAMRGRVDVQNSTRLMDDFGYDGLATMRGYPNRYLRGSKGLFINHEARLVLAENLFDNFYIAAVGFYDYGWTGDHRGPWGRFGQALGGGFRAAVNKLVGLYIRTDVARSLERNNLGVDFSVGVSELF